MRYFLSAMCAIVIAAAPLTTAGSASAATPDPAAGVGIQLTSVPAAAVKADPRAASYIVGSVEPGSSSRSHITVTNPSSATQKVYVYTGAAHIADGAFQGDANPSSNELTSWTKLSAAEITLAGDAKKTVTVTITVPSDAAPGEQYGAVWAEVRGAATADSPVVQASRAGIRMYVTVGGNNAAATDFTVTSLAPSRTDAGVPQVSALVTNSGGRAIDTTGTLTLTDGPGGLSAGPFTLARATTVAPGEAQNAVFSLDKSLPNGPWTAHLSLTSGLVERSADATFSFPKAGTGTAATPTSPDNTLMIVLIIVSGVIVLAGIGTAVVLSRRAAARKRGRA